MPLLCFDWWYFFCATNNDLVEKVFIAALGAIQKHRDTHVADHYLSLESPCQIRYSHPIALGSSLLILL